MTEPQSKKQLQSTASLVLLGSELVAPAITGIVIDQVFGISPWCTIIGAFLGMGITAFHGYRIITKLENRT